MPFLFGPVIAWLASSVGSLLSAMLVWFAGNIAKRIAFFVAVALAFGVITSTVVAAIVTGINGVAHGAGGAAAQFYSLASWLIDFGYVAGVIGVIVGVETACLIAKWQIRLLDLKARI